MLEKEIYTCLHEDEEIQTLLASYEGGSAIFHQMVPADTDAGWDGVQYPRITYDVDTQSNPERKNAGTLLVSIACKIDSTQPEPIAKRVQALLDGTLFTTDDGYTAAASWSRTDSFTQANTNAIPQIYGADMEFELHDFPSPVLIGMDPLALMNSYVKRLYPHAMVLHVDTLPSVFKPTNDEPAIYWRVRSIGSDQQMIRYDTNMVTWMRASLQCHVLAPSTQTRTNLIKGIAESLYETREIAFPDQSPFLVRSLSGNTGASPLRVGQLTLEGSYGVLRKLEGTPIRNISMRQENGI